jgi:hypothetical protein
MSLQIRTLAVAASVVLCAHSAHSQDRARYRDYHLGSDLSSVAGLAKVPATGARTIHQRPAVLQELEWRSPYGTLGSTASTDPVQRIVFSFYDNQLFKLVISYDRQRTNGLTDSDMVDAISRMYGVAMLQPVSQAVFTGASRGDGDLGAPIAQWGDADGSVGLYRSSYASEFRVVVISPRLETLSRIAAAEALRLDELEAPQRESERKLKVAEDTRILQEKARLANKATFLP